MASINIIGTVSNIKFLPNQGGCLVFLNEFKNGYRKKDGTRVGDKVYQWRVIFKQGLTKYISDHFSTDMTVEIKGDAIPFAVNHGQEVDGYSVIGQTMNRFSYPRPSAKLEQRAIRESAESSSGVPDLESYNIPDF